jgi:hypothetical protein
LKKGVIWNRFDTKMGIAKRGLGKTGMEVTILGLGGVGILRTYGYEKEAYELINRALELGINYFESTRAYSCSESYYGHVLKERERRYSTPVNPMPGTNRGHSFIYRKH